MRSHAADLQGSVKSLEASLLSSRGGGLPREASILSSLEQGYIAAQRCSIWREKVQVGDNNIHFITPHADL